ncbi:MAG: hypothetical protein R3F46_08960 [bacterium]
MASTRENIHSSLICQIDRMELLVAGKPRLSEFGRIALANVFLQLRKEALRSTPDSAIVRESLATWNAITGEEFLAERLQREFEKLSAAWQGER